MRVSSSSASQKKPADRGLRAALRWQGALGPLRQRPVLAAGMALLCSGLIVAFVYAVVLPYFETAAHWQRATTAMLDPDLPRAREHLQACVDAWPGSAEANFYLGRTCRRLGDLTQAERYLTKAAQLGWTEGLIELELLLLQAQQGAFEGDLENTLRGYLEIRQHPEETLIFEALAKGYLHTYRLFEARELLDAWSAAHPEQWQPRLWRGTVLERLGKAEFEKARHDYERVLELRPHTSEARLRLARVTLGIGQDHASAARHFELYLADQPLDAEALTGLARCQRALGQFDKSRDTLQRLLKAHQGHTPGLVALALLESDQENYTRALELLREAQRAGPNQLETIHHLALVLRRLNLQAEADRYEARFKELEADLRELDKATKRVAQNARDVDARHTAGAILIKVGKDLEGLRWLQTALRENPNHKPTHLTLAAYYEKSDQPELKRQAEAHRVKGR